MPVIENIIFDLDGTLIESEAGIIHSVVYALDKMGIVEEHHEELRSFIGPPLINSFAHRYKLEDHDAHRAVDYYREYFAEKGIYENHLYPGIIELLNKLSENGFDLFVATSKPTVYSEKILAYHGIKTRFKGIVGSNLDHTRIDKTEVLNHLFEVFDLPANKSVMVGDREFDVLGAKNLSVVSVAVTYGHGSMEELESAGPDHLINRPEELWHLLKELKA